MKKQTKRLVDADCITATLDIDGHLDIIGCNTPIIRFGVIRKGAMDRQRYNY